MGVPGDLDRVELDLGDVLEGELAAVEDEENFVAVLRSWCSVDDEHAADRGRDAELFRDFAGGGFSWGLAGTEEAAADVPAGAVGGAHEKDAAVFVEEEHSGGGASAGYRLVVLALGHPPRISGCGD